MNLSDYYLPVLAFHVISVLSWMAMLFYLPRLYVYHQENKDKKEFIEIVKIQEYKLYKYIGVPAMWATIASGVFMIIANPDLFKQGWFHAKLLLIIILIGYSHSLGVYLNKLKKDECKKEGKFFRAYNEVPTVLAILIVTYVILKDIPILFSIGITLFFAFVMYKIMTVKEKTEDKENQDASIH
ncbi:MAG: protoporphyrinogen oxidase HemJ [Campylobacterota bacterium]|nr:protoporphyrinogen oxidase HemJ [Campylobacterota bacterium]